MSWALLYLISEWMIRICMLVHVPRRRTPSAARMWLMLIFLLPLPGLLVYAVFGRPRLPKRRVELQHSVSDLLPEAHRRKEGHAVPLSGELRTELKQAVTLALNLGDFGICENNDIELLEDYRGIIDRIVADIEAAQYHVHLLYYVFAEDDVGSGIARALERAVHRGVKCRVMMDGDGSRAALPRLATAMRASGVDVTTLLPVGWFSGKNARLDMRNHRKITVIDGRVGYFGSQNMVAPESARGYTNEELVARVTGPLVAQLQAVFLMDLYCETETLLQGADLFPDIAGVGSIPAQVLPSGPTYPNRNAHEIIVALMYAARHRIVITTPYFIPDEPFIQAMRAAVRRGVEVHLVVSQQSNQLLVHLAQKSYYEELLGAGVRVHLYSGNFLHAKHLTIDDSVAMIGSSNMDIRSFTLNSEVSVLIYESRFVAKLLVIEERYFAKSHILSSEEWEQRPLWAQCVQNIARLADSFL